MAKQMSQMEGTKKDLSLAKRASGAGKALYAKGAGKAGKKLSDERNYVKQLYAGYGANVALGRSASHKTTQAKKDVEKGLGMKNVTSRNYNNPKRKYK